MNSESESRTRSGFGKYVRMDTAIFLASMVGTFTLCGYAYLEKFYLTLAIPPDRITISAQQLAAYGAANFSSVLTSIVFAMALVGLVTLVVVLFERPVAVAPPPTSPAAWKARVRTHFNQHRMGFAVVGGMVVLALSLYLASQLFIHMPSKQGRASALRFVSACIERRFIYNNLDEFKGCQAGESDDMLYLVQRITSSPEDVEFRAYQLPKAGLKVVVGAPQRFTR